MLTEDWRGLGVLYVCPIKALLNNLDARLSRYCTLLGRRSALWHGDVPTGQKKAILRDPPDLLLTTPESLEVMLVSGSVDERALFTGLRAVVVDEVHAFAGDDRGWHLLSVLARLRRLCGWEFQRIGLSATVGILSRSDAKEAELAEIVHELMLRQSATFETEAGVLVRVRAVPQEMRFEVERAEAEEE